MFTNDTFTETRNIGGEYHEVSSVGDESELQYMEVMEHSFGIPIMEPEVIGTDVGHLALVRTTPEEDYTRGVDFWLHLGENKWIPFDLTVANEQDEVSQKHMEIKRRKLGKEINHNGYKAKVRILQIRETDLRLAFPASNSERDLNRAKSAVGRIKRAVNQQLIEPYMYELNESKDKRH